MNREKAYIEGFVKRASEYGYSDRQAIALLKESGVLGDAWGGLKNLAGNAWEGTKNFVKNNGFQNPSTPEQTAAYNQSAHENYARQMYQGAGKAVTPPQIHIPNT